MLRNRLIALGITISIHVIGFLLIYWLTLSTHVVAKGKELTLIPVGVLDERASQGGALSTPESAPAPQTTISEPTSSTKLPKEVDAPLVTTKMPEATLPAPAPKPIEKPQESAEERAAREAKRAEEAEKRRREEINSKITGAFGKGKGKETGSNNSQGGSASQGGESVGAGFSLAGRSISGNGGLPARPNGFRPTRGTVVVRIVVNDEGRVIEATQSLRGTNVTDTQTIQAAVRAARATRFNAQQGAADQEGTITYHFDIQ